MPVYGCVKGVIGDGTFVPIVDARVGKVLTHEGGLYINGAVGLRCAIDKRFGMYLTLGYSTQNFEFERLEYEKVNNTLTRMETSQVERVHTLLVRIGAEF